MRVMLAVPWVLVLGVLAHSAEPATASDPARQAVAAFEKSAQVEFKPCPNKACIDASVVKCVPAHHAFTYSTVEGSRVSVDAYSVKEPTGCHVVLFYDLTKDYWGGCKLRKQTCPTLRASEGDGSMRRGCTAADVVYEAPICKNPLK